MNLSTLSFMFLNVSYIYVYVKHLTGKWLSHYILGNIMGNDIIWVDNDKLVIIVSVVLLTSFK